MNINFNYTLLLPLFVRLLAMVFVAKVLSMALWFFLPKEGTQNSVESQVVIPYMRYDIDAFRLKASEVKTLEEASSLSIDSIVLKAIYMMGKESIIVVAPKSNIQKSKTMNIGEIFEGYKLEKVYSEYALLSKYSKQYKLYLSEPKASSRWKNTKAKSSKSDTSLYRIASEEVKKVVANPADIWKNIGLHEHFTNNKQDGFQVTFVKRGTVFEALGLEAGDVIQSINNKEIRNNAQAFGAYQEFKDAKALKVTIMRGKETMELEYEIY